MDLYKEYKEDKKIDKSPGSMYNSFRSKVYTQKGKEIGFPESWHSFKSFKEEMSDGWEFGLLLVRIDNTLPYSKENCRWVEKGLESLNRLITLEYNGVIKTIFEWCSEFDLNYNAARQRYFKHKEYTPEKILFGKKKLSKRKLLNAEDLSIQEFRNKASKMLSSYKIKDKKKGFITDMDIDFTMNLIKEPCIYCGDTNYIGADRLDNNIGHIKSNVVPCCVICNTARNNNFTHEEMIILGKTIKQIKEKRNEYK